jgi:hypothetical protein
MKISEFRRVLQRRFGELGDPVSIHGLCPLGLVYPVDVTPWPVAVAEQTGLPISYCVGVAEAWDDAPGCLHAHSGTPEGRALYARGFRDGSVARRRWLAAHPEAPSTDTPSSVPLENSFL